MKRFIKVMKALSDPNRVKIVKMLGQRTLCVCELQSALGLAQSTVSKHLRVLEEADMVTFEKDGLWVNYKLNRDTDNVYAATMISHMDKWLLEDRQIVSVLNKLKDISRDKILK